MSILIEWAALICYGVVVGPTTAKFELWLAVPIIIMKTGMVTTSASQVLASPIYYAARDFGADYASNYFAR